MDKYIYNILVLQHPNFQILFPTPYNTFLIMGSKYKDLMVQKSSSFDIAKTKFHLEGFFQHPLYIFISKSAIQIAVDHKTRITWEVAILSLLLNVFFKLSWNDYLFCKVTS